MVLKIQKLINIFKLIRIHQWLKNIFILLPIFFGLKINNIPVLINTIIITLGFSFVASSIYIFNDLCDVDSDKNHPSKRTRPIASGKITVNEAVILIMIMLFLGLITINASIASSKVYYLILIYLAQNILYSLKIKKHAIWDVVFIAFGFVIRILIGGEISDVDLTPWILILTFILALFLALSKRYDDLRLIGVSEIKIRESVSSYNLVFLQVTIGVLAALVINSYILYTVSTDAVNRFGEEIYYTGVFVIIGMIRYLQLVFVYEKGESPTKILIKDRVLQIVITLWFLLFCFIIYFNK